MNYILLVVSIVIDTLKNIYYNHFSKTGLQTQRDALLFQVISCLGSVLFFLVMGASFRISGYSFVMAVIFAAITAGAQYLSLLAMSLGPMSYSVLFTYLSMLIPTLFGIVYSHLTITLLQVIGLILMIITFWFSADLKKDTAMTAKWLAAAFGSFLCWGLVGVCQQLHQSSAYAQELDGFLLWSFLFAALIFALFYWFVPGGKAAPKEASAPNTTPVFRIRSGVTIFVVIAGVGIGAVNQIHLYLSGRMPSILFFPIANGGVIILSGLAAVLLFREKLNVRQRIGILTGLLSVCLLGM